MILRVELDFALQLGAMVFRYTLGGWSARRMWSFGYTLGGSSTRRTRARLGSGITVILRVELNLALQLGAVLFGALVFDAMVFAEWTALTRKRTRIVNTRGQLPWPRMDGMMSSYRGSLEDQSCWTVGMITVMACFRHMRMGGEEEY